LTKNLGQRQGNQEKEGVEKRGEGTTSGTVPESKIWWHNGVLKKGKKGKSARVAHGREAQEDTRTSIPGDRTGEGNPFNWGGKKENRPAVVPPPSKKSFKNEEKREGSLGGKGKGEVRCWNSKSPPPLVWGGEGNRGRCVARLSGKKTLSGEENTGEGGK